MLIVLLTNIWECQQQQQLTQPQKEFYNKVVKIVIVNVLHVQLQLLVNHVQLEMLYQELLVSLSLENYKLEIFS